MSQVVETKQVEIGESTRELIGAALAGAYSMEKYQLGVMRSVIETGEHQEVQEILARHSQETSHQIKRLEEIGRMFGFTVFAEQHNPMVKGFVSAADVLLNAPESTLRELKLVEHLIMGEACEIACYQLMSNLCKKHGQMEAHKAIEAILVEENTAYRELIESCGQMD